MRPNRRRTWLLLALAACSATLLVLWRPTGAPPPTAAVPAPEPGSETPVDVSRSDRSAIGERAAPSPGPQESPVPEPSTRSLASGSVRDTEGGPVADVGIGTRADHLRGLPATHSGADGSFELMVAKTPATLIAVDPRWVCVRSGTAFGRGAERGATVVVAPSIAVAGRVVESFGDGLPGAKLRIDTPLGSFADATELLATTQREEWNTASDDEGRFAFPTAPSLGGARLVVSLAGYETRSVELPSTPTSELEVALVPLAPDRRVLVGEVVHADGSPAPGASVWLGDVRARADEEGAFRLAFGSVTAQTPLIALHPGHQPAIVPDFGAVALAGPLPLERVRLVLGGEALSIRGRVLDATGQPLARWSVELLDGTPTDPVVPSSPAVEELAGDQGRSVRTDKDGRFVLEGLSSRSYVLRAHGSRPRAQILSAPIEAGASDVELRLPPAEPPSPVQGRVLTLAGEPVPNVRVGRNTIGTRRPGESTTVGDDGTTTDADGGFLLHEVPSGWIELVVEGDPILPASHVLSPEEAREDVRIHVVHRRRFRFESALAQDPPDELRAIDSANSAVAIWSFDAAVPRAAGRAALRDGRSGELAVGETARKLVIYRRGQELARVELALGPAEVGLVIWP